jgi:hypothetical protein
MDNISSSKIRLNDTIDLILRTTGVAIFYTFVVILYGLIFRISYAQPQDSHRKLNQQTTCTLVFATVLFICATLHVIGQNDSAKFFYVDNGTRGHQASPTSSVVIVGKLLAIVNTVEDLLILGVLVSLYGEFCYTLNC